MIKLVRDKIPNIMKNNKQLAFSRKANIDEIWPMLTAKLYEEVNEFLNTPSIEEIADIYEVIDAIVSYKGWDNQKIISTKNNKKQIRGGFEDFILLKCDIN